MNSSTLHTTHTLLPLARPSIYWTLADALVLARRQLVQIPRIPEELLFATIQPIMFVFLFRYVFGGAIAVSGTSYVNYLMAGIFAQTVIFGATNTGIGLATDLQRGLVDRFRSLPMARSAVLTGRTLADLVRSTFVVFVMWMVGLLVGFQPQGNVLSWVAAAGLLLLTSFAFSWISRTVGLVVSSGEAAQSERVVPSVTVAARRRAGPGLSHSADRLVVSAELPVWSLCYAWWRGRAVWLRRNLHPRRHAAGRFYAVVLLGALRARPRGLPGFV